MRILISLLFISLLLGCNNGVEYSQYASLPDGWEAHNPVLFQVEVTDSLTPKDIFIMVRNTEQYPFSNLFLITKMEEPKSNKVIVDTLEYEMATPEGKWLGDGYSAIKESKLWYKEQFVFPTKGKYNIKIEQAMRKIGDNEGVMVLKGITEVGLRVEKR
jgi:gliding motility-associated lipoprotein gldH